MGLYSNNRVAGIVAEAAKTPEQDLALEAFVKEIEETAFDPAFGHILEAAIQLHENDKRMFDTLIECDFISVTNEAVLLEEEAAEANAKANETKFAKIGEKIHQIIENVIAWIKKAAANIIYKITDMVKSDKKLIETYKPVLKMENLKDFPGIADFAFTTDVFDKNEMNFDDELEKVKDVINDFMKDFKNQNDRESVDAKYEEIHNRLKSLEDVTKGFNKGEGTSKEKIWKPSSQAELDVIINTVSSASETIKFIKTESAKMIKALTDIKREVKASIPKGKSSELEVYKMNRAYEVVSKTCKIYSKQANGLTHVAAMNIASKRKALILCGRYALKASKGAKVEEKEQDVAAESAIMNALGESSDMYVFECFA